MIYKIRIHNLKNYPKGTGRDYWTSEDINTLKKNKDIEIIEERESGSD